MIWATLALWVVSFIAVALLAPKPELEDARADELDPNNFPRATENAPVPLILGCARLKSPNTLWYGNFRADPITEKVKTGLFSSETVKIGYTYYLTMDLGLCLGPNVQLKKIYIDEEEVNPGDLVSETEIDPGLVNNSFDLNGTLPDLTPSTPLTMPSTVPTPPFPRTEWWNFGARDMIFRENALGERSVERASTGLGQVAIDIPIADLNLTEADIDANRIRIEVDFRSESFLGFPTRDHDIQCADDTGSNTGGSFQGGGAMPNTGPTVQTQTVSGNVYPGTRYFTILIASQGVRVFPLSFRAYNSDEGGEILVSSESFDIFEPELFGGKEEGGGFISNFTFFPGNFDETPSSYLEGILGSGNVPAYNGISRIVLENANIGESAQLRRFEITLAKYTDLLTNGFNGRIAADAEDADPAEALYFILTDTWAGMGIPPENVDIQSFRDASSTLIDEANGVSIIITSPQSGRRAITEILRQIDGILYQDGSTGRIVLKLIRDDYVADDLLIYDEDDIIKINSFNKTSWQDVKSQVKVSYQDRNRSEPERVAIAQNMATANMIGQLRTTDISFPFCYDSALANRLASRELSVLSTPLFKMQVEMNRNGYNIKPGDVIKISWSEFGLSEVIMRVQRVDVGALLDNRVVLDLVQDIFSIDDTVFATPEDTSWVDDRPQPETIDTFTLADMPYFYAQRLEYPVSDGFGDVIPFPLQPKLASNTFRLISGTVSGTLDVTSPDGVLYPLAGRLTAAYERTAGFETGVDATGFTIDGVVGQNLNDVPTAASTADVRSGEAGILYVGGEWMGYEGVTDHGDGTFTLTNIRRALFGTTPAAHSEDDPVYFLNVSLLGDGTKGSLLAEDGTIYFKILDQVGNTTRAEESETEQDQVLGDVADRPLRPRNLQIDGARSTIPFDAAATPTFDLTWVASNRDASQVTFEDDAAETPDQTEQYDLEVWIDGVQDMTLSDTNITSPYAVDLSAASGTTGEFRLYSKRTGGDGKTSVGYAWYPFTLSRATMDGTTITMDDSGTTMDQTA